MSWDPLLPASPVLNEKIVEYLKDRPEEAKELAKGELWMNSTYTVDRRDMGADGAGGRVVWLSIKRNDREPCKDWRDFQKIKNQLCGREAEGVELYPAESRVVDTANQYHLWVFTKQRMPLGFERGEKMTAAQAAVVGAKQREGA